MTDFRRCLGPAAWMFVLALAMFVPSMAAGGLTTSGDDFYCDDHDLKHMNDIRHNAAVRTMNIFGRNWNKPFDFSSLYCIPSLMGNFDSIGNMFSSGLYNLIQSAINKVLGQVCQAALQPLQNAASEICIPNFTMPSFDFNLSTKSSYCEGMQLITVTPSYGTPYTGGAGDYFSTPGIP